MRCSGSAVPGARHGEETVRDMTFRRRRVLRLLLALSLICGTQPALAASAAPGPLATEAESDLDTTPDVVIEPIPEAAMSGAFCLMGTAAVMGAAIAAGPTESLLLISGAMHVPSGSAVLLIPLMSLLGTAGCAIAAGIQPVASWAYEQSDNIAAHARASGRSAAELVYAPAVAAPADPAGPAPDNGGADAALPPVRPMSEDELQAAGCFGGGLAGFGAAMATSPTEVAMLSSGALIVVSSTPLLVLGLISSIVVAGCAIGNYTVLPAQALVDNFDAVGDALFGGLKQLGIALGDQTGRTIALFRAPPSPVAIATDASGQ